MLTVPKLELHLAHACNLRCEGCSHFSNYALPGRVTLAEAGGWLEAWAARLAPVRLSLLGGEPLLNPELPGFLQLARRLWPRTLLRLVTNGLLLGRWESLWPVLEETRAVLTLSVHSRDEDYRTRLAPLRQRARDEAARRGFTFEERDSVQGWYRLYQGRGPGMRPFEDGDPAASWRVCQNKHCVTLQDNALWKCPPLAHLPRAAAKLGFGHEPAWRTPLAYRPLGLDASDDDIRAFFARGPEPACGMCPSRLEFFEKSIT